MEVAKRVKVAKRMRPSCPSLFKKSREHRRVVDPKFRHLAPIARLYYIFLQPATPGQIAWHLFGRRGYRVAEIEGHAVGFYIAVDRDEQSGLWLDYLGVDPGYRNAGIGHVLLADIEDRARALGYASIELSVFEWNKAAIRFY